MGNNKGTSGDVTRTVKCVLCDRQFRGDVKMVNKLYKLHMEKAHGETVANDPLKQDNAAYIRGASKYKQKDQVTEFKRFHEGKAIYNEFKEELY